MVEHIESEAKYFRNPMWPYKEYKRIIYEPGRVARIKMNRPRYLNAQSHAMLAELEDAYDRASDDPNVHVIVVSGEGRCWSAGDDANGLTPESAPCLVTDETREELLERFGGDENALWHQYTIEHDYLVGWFLGQKILRVPKPTIAMVHGLCIYGAMGHATSCDIIFASEDAQFLSAGGGGRLAWDIGFRKALEISYEHRFMTAQEAYDYRLVNRVFPDKETLERETLAFAERVANEVPLSLHRTKKSYIQTMECQGLKLAHDTQLEGWAEGWRRQAREGHAMRYEGRGMARTPVAYYNLAATLLSQGKQVPQHIIEALQRAAVRDDRGAWQRALHQEGRDPRRIARADADAKAWDERLANEGIKDVKERIKDMLEAQKWGIPDRIERT